MIRCLIISWIINIIFLPFFPVLSDDCDEVSTFPTFCFFFLFLFFFQNFNNISFFRLVLIFNRMIGDSWILWICVFCSICCIIFITYSWFRIIFFLNSLSNFVTPNCTKINGWWFSYSCKLSTYISKNDSSNL